MENYECVQPEYMKKFQCDGQACNAHCCRYGWQIDIDKKTYNLYSNLKPESAAREITQHITKNEGNAYYSIKLNENGTCPFLTENNLCKLQREHGEEFLSKTCALYPRYMRAVGNVYECSLNLSCPVAAKLILLESEPLKFEKTKMPEKFPKYPLPPLIFSNDALSENILTIQKTTVSVLQECSLSIDSRLLMLGLYCDKLDELLETDNEVDFQKLQAVYQNPVFLQGQAKKFSSLIRFDAQSHIHIMINLLETLYGEGNIQTPEDRKYLDAVINVLQLKTDENNHVKISELTKNYISYSEARQKFLQRFSAIFENYLVNEWFLNLYPLRFNTSFMFDYLVFITVYKLLEFFTLSSWLADENFDEAELIAAISWYVHNFDHNVTYIKKILEYLQKQNDIVGLMQSMLQV